MAFVISKAVRWRCNHFLPGVQRKRLRDINCLAQRQFCQSNSDVETQSHQEIQQEDIVWNPCNVQMIPDKLHQQIFIDSYRQTTFPRDVVSKCESHLTDHGLWNKQVKEVQAINLDLPQLQGEDINDHFRNIALSQTFRYKALLDTIASSSVPDMPKQWEFVSGWTKYMENGEAVCVPYPQEDALVFDVEVSVTSGNAPTLACALTSKGWYSWCSEALVSGKGPVDATTNLCLDDLIPLETSPGEYTITSECQKEKIVIGHNVSYDRARIKEQYFLRGTKVRFLDTMSLHIAISGITSFQRALKLTENAATKTMSSTQLRKLGIESGILEWSSQSSLNNLADVYKLYCKEEISKATRDIFVKGSLSDIRQAFQELATYCANDVVATKKIFVELLPLYNERFPHPVTLSGMLEMGTTYLPINSNWCKYIQRAETAYNDHESEIKSILMQKAEEALQLLEGEKYKMDPWLWDLDWKIPKRKSKSTALGNNAQPLPAWYRKLLCKKTDENFTPGPANISTSMQLVPKLLRLTWFGFPLHYSRKGGWGFLIHRPNTSTSSEPDEAVHFAEETPYDLLEEIETQDSPSSEDPNVSKFPFEQWLTIWKQAHKSLLSRSEAISKKKSVAGVLGAELRNRSEQSAENISDFVTGLESLASLGMWDSNKKKKRTNSIGEECSPHPNCIFIPLPHKDGPSNRVGNPLAKDFLAKIEDGVLASADDNSVANTVVRLSKTTSYWKNNRDRIMGQMAVWFKSSEQCPKEIGEPDNCAYGAILPQVAVSGTLTRRAVEPTWMTASNAYEDRIGSELKGMVQAPPSYHFVGADVDSQELWIASVIGDASFCGIHGCTALGWMTLQGNKSDGTDMHSKTASLIGIGRDQAKILNYGRIYGAGVKFAERLLMQFNKQLSSSDARSKANAIYKMTKGERKYILNEDVLQQCESLENFNKKKDGEPFSKTELRGLMSLLQIPSQHFFELVEKLAWDGGTESHMFNRLEAIAQEDCPTTPFLKCCISRSLVPAVVNSDFMTSRVNWVVQSSAVDYLHLMLTCMKWLIEKYDIQARFSISVHDEVRYLVKSEDRFRAALALQITNLLTRSVCAHQLGMYDLPMSVGFFSCVDIDKVLRKEVTQDCVTPSNPSGLSSGYGIPLGTGLTISDLLKVTGGLLAKDRKIEDF